jgi:hypothetical protein
LPISGFSPWYERGGCLALAHTYSIQVMIGSYRAPQSSSTGKKPTEVEGIAQSPLPSRSALQNCCELRFASCLHRIPTAEPALKELAPSHVWAQRWSSGRRWCCSTMQARAPSPTSHRRSSRTPPRYTVCKLPSPCFSLLIPLFSPSLLRIQPLE